MKRALVGLLALIMLLSVPYTAWGATNLSTEQKFDVLKQKNIFTGYADGSPHLYDSMTREQLAAVLVRLLDLPVQAPSPSFSDVLKTRWSFQHIETVSRVGLMKGTANRIFSPVSNVTVEQLAVVIIRSYGITGRGSSEVSGKVSKWAKPAVSLALDHHIIPQMNDYTSAASRALLVEAAYAVYEATHIEPLSVRSVEPLNNQTVRVNLAQSTDKADKGRFSLRDTNNNIRSIQQVTIASDGLSITLLTDRLIGGIYHTLTIDGVQYGFTSIPDDTTKPQIITQPERRANRVIEITFSEPIEKNSALNSNNYLLSGELRFTTMQLSSDQRRISFTTTDQSNGKRYQLTVRNVRDLAGNTMDTRSDLYFEGNNDSSKPKVTSVQVNATAAVIIKFSERVNTGAATQTGNYSIDKGLGVTQATIDGDGRTVTLRTTGQQDATLYNLTIMNIPDMAGNVMDPSPNWKFGGNANPETPVRLQGVQAINVNTVEVTFDRPLTDNDVNNLKLAITKDNDSGVSMTDWQAYVSRKPGSDRIAVVQFRTKGSDPELFRVGHVYESVASGVASLQTSDNANRAEFAGTRVDNRSPFVTQAIATSRTTVKVLFSEPVKNVNETAFRIREKDGGAVDVDYDELNDKNKVVTEVVLKLKGELQPGKSYAMTFVPDIITDAAGWNGLRTREGDQPLTVWFNSN